MTEREELEALLRAGGLVHPGAISAIITGQHSASFGGVALRGILAHLRAEKAKAVQEAEAAALERAAADFDRKATEALQSTAGLHPMRVGIPKMEAAQRRFVAAAIRSLISPTSRTALSERDARVREEGRREGLRQASKHAGLLASRLERDGARADYTKTVRWLAEEITQLRPRPAQDVEERR